MIFSKSRINQILFFAIIIAAIFAGWTVSELFTSKNHNNDIIVNFNLTDHFDSKVSEKTYEGFNKVFFFGFTHCPDICPISANLMANVINELNSEQISTKSIKFFFVTVDPKRDTPQRLKEFLKSFNSEIIGLTGTQNELIPIWKDFFVHVESSLHSEYQNNLNQSNNDSQLNIEEVNYMVQHTAFYYLFDNQNNLINILPFGSTIEHVKGELKKLLKII